MVRKIEISKNYFQFHAKLKYPIFIKFQNELMADDYHELVKSLGFEPASEQVIRDPSVMRKRPKILNIVLASNKIAKQIGHFHQEFDHYGEESITPHESYEIYRLRGQGIMVFSRNSIFWEMGVTDTDCPSFKVHLKTMLNRFLALALETYGVLSYWGSLVDEGILIAKQNEMQGHAVYIDVHQKKILSGESMRELVLQSKILRVSSEYSRSVRMSSDELYTFLMAHSSYFSYGTITPLMRDATMKLLNCCSGFKIMQKSAAGGMITTSKTVKSSP